MKYFRTCQRHNAPSVAPFAGAWIEIEEWVKNGTEEEVAPFAGAWIEINKLEQNYIVLFKSLPSRERGLKLYSIYPLCLSVYVAPFAGAWIEILLPIYSYFAMLSLPSRERGLK